jgi:hypothetical protein
MSNIYQLYQERGLNNYKLKSLDDIKAIYGHDIPALKGYPDLSDENKELVNKFIINFFNAQGMDRRATIKPLQVNYVTLKEYGKPVTDPDAPDGKNYELVVSEFRRLNAKGNFEKFRMYKHEEIDLNKCKTFTSCFLRIDYKWGTKREWLHILSPIDWY